MLSCRALQGCTTLKVEFMLTLSKLTRQYPSTSFSKKFDSKAPFLKLEDSVLQERLVSRKSNCSSSRGERINHSWLVRELFFNGGRAETEFFKHLWHSNVEILLV